MKDVIELAKQAGFQKFLKPADRPEMICDPAALERFATLVRNAALEEAARYCHDASIPQPDQIHTDAQWAAACLAVNIRNLKEPTP